MTSSKINQRILPLYAKGEKILQRKFNQPRVILNALAAPSPGSIHTPRQRNNFGVRQFKVVDVREDYLECHTFDTIEEGTEIINVAMPYLLRFNIWDSLTNANALQRILNDKTIKFEYKSPFERTAVNVDDEEDTQFQRIIGRYLETDIIYAGIGILGGTDVKDEEDNIVQWLDMNIDGRFWAEATEEEEEESA